MKIDLQWPHVVVFVTVTCTLGFLVYAGKLPADVLAALAAWLVPSPIGKKASE